jgi:glycosyltransferase involved in cell wall biosynthesis
MRVFSIQVVRNEADVIAANLRDALRWSARIFVMDNGSTDGTWEIVQRLAAEEPRIVAWKQWDTPFLNGLRGHVFNAFRHEAKEGDWWCMRLDSDEFYIGDPRDVLVRVPTAHHVVCKDSFEFRITQEDADQYTFTGRFEDDRDKLRYYLPLTWREARFFRHRERLTWDERLPFPVHMGIVAREVVPVRHYKFRSPRQLAERAAARARTVEQAATQHGGTHPGLGQWRKLPAHELNDHGRYFARKDLLFDDGTLPLRSQGTMAPHRNKWYARAVMRIMHSTALWP